LIFVPNNYKKQNNKGASKQRETACAEEEEKRKPYLSSEHLAVIPFTVEEKVAFAIHGVSGGNHAVHRQRPIQPESFLLYLLDADREDLQGGGDGSTRQCSVREVHRTQ
jgi:hypothetical protein